MTFLSIFFKKIYLLFDKYLSLLYKLASFSLPPPERGLAGERTFGTGGSLNYYQRGKTMKKKIRKSAIKRVRMCGFRKRMRTKGGRAIIKRRRAKGRKLNI